MTPQIEHTPGSFETYAENARILRAMSVPDIEVSSAFDGNVGHKHWRETIEETARRFEQTAQTGWAGRWNARHGFR